MFKKIAIIGLGLMGGSFATACRKHHPDCNISAYDNDQHVLNTALDKKIIDNTLTQIKDAANTDLIMIATPLGAFEKIFTELAPHLLADSIITDMGSVKQSVVHFANTILQEKSIQFIPGHPIVGSEKSGINASNADLFQQQQIVLTPSKQNKKNDIEQLASFWQSLGAEVVYLTTEEHDEMLAMTSHLPHVISYAFVEALSRQKSIGELLPLSAGSFADMTRIAKSNPELWLDIFLQNSDILIEQITVMQDSLESFKYLLQDGDEAKVLYSLQEIKKQIDIRGD